MKYYSAYIASDHLETDDEISRLHSTNGDTIIVSTDKDFLQLEGMHFNPNTKECYYVSCEEALRNFYKQVIIGDSADAIPGIYGIGEKSTHVRRLWSMTEEEDMFNLVLDLYKAHYRSYAQKFIKENLILLYLVRDDYAYWRDYFNLNHRYWEE
jgi:hypothetical protein